ncbi:Intramembrane protease RasP/YluC, implicated in cell division based on FtsL cleavage [Labilithrix luteola]|uniref:Intramembrane protease RasP/YluC, implicated in cell division based on FtsL cleavage n=1 Tax=Labilithrix luteola TaxID=1391654 RepID=A0A0K1PUV4_9BACT|nr:M50 family metallopeptidase [Labilithrix luteola]AKU97310.1 Intramembrane protease RasP/YluC, implicated in cell division based on FtsL cleavage [Labilithrix luteola]
MSSVAYAIVAILGLALLMVVHEGGHYLAARRFGMRVTKFSIGFGPTLWKHRPKNSETTFQIGIIPFLAYVQIAGMNPYEEIDPKDKSSYANASLVARVSAIAAGPLANYLFASVLMFFGFLIGGNTVVDETTMRIAVDKDNAGPAAVSGMKRGDRILAVNGEAIHDWKQLQKVVGSHPGDKLDVEIERGTEKLHVFPVPVADAPNKPGRILIGQFSEVVPVTVGQAAVLSVTEPPKVVVALVKGLGRMLTFKEKPEFSGPVAIGREVAAAAEDGVHTYLKLLGLLSAYIGAFNLLPFPALDGGRLLFLGFEAASRRRADAKIEGTVHAIGLLMFLTLIAVITYSDLLMPKH